MLVLVVDTSTPAVTAAVVRVDPDAVTLVAEQRSVDGRAHGELLGPAVTAVLAGSDVRPKDLEAVVAGLGPGPFTGLRVGLVTAAVLSQTLGVPAYGVCSLDGIGATTAGAALVATDARRREVYWARYLDGVRVAGPAVDRPADIDGAGVTVLAGAGADLLGLDRPVVEPRYPQAVALAGLAAPRIRERAPGETLTPLYLRRPDAVEPTARKPVSR